MRMSAPAIPLVTRTHIFKAVRQMKMGLVKVEYRKSARRRIIDRAKELNSMDLIPDDWNEDGTLK